MIDQFEHESDEWINKISKCATFDQKIISLEHLSKEEIINLIVKANNHINDPMVTLSYIIGCAFEKAYREGSVKKHIDNGKIRYSPVTQKS